MVDEEERPHGQGATLWGEVEATRSSWHCGKYRHGEMHGEGVFRSSDGDTFTGEFADGKPVATGRLEQRIGDGEASVRYVVAYDGLRSFHEGAVPMTKERAGREAIEDRLMRVAGMLSGPRGGDVAAFNYDHCTSVSGPLVWAQPPMADCPLFNAEDCRGKIVLVSRGHIEFCRKYVMVREAGAAGLVVVGDDPAADKYHAPCPCIHTGAFLSPDLEPRLASVAHVEFPAVYVLKKFAPNLKEGAVAFIHFDAVSPPGWKGGAIFVQDSGSAGGTSARGKALRNPEGEAQAQWSERDLLFDSEEAQASADARLRRAAPPTVLECEAGAIEHRAPRECTVKIPLLFRTEVTHYGFRFSFGEQEWTISKRFSAFDRLDNLLNANFGLPPVGLPPKQLFGLDDPEVIRSRHAVLAAYLKDCIARPVLILSQELQDFIEMPREVRERVRKGGI